MKLDKVENSEAPSNSMPVNLHAFHTHIETKITLNLISILYTSGCQHHRQQLALPTTLLKEPSVKRRQKQEEQM